MPKLQKRDKIQLQQVILLIRALKRLNQSELKTVLASLDNTSIDKICRCVHNVCYEDIGLSSHTKTKLRKKLSPHKKNINFLAKQSLAERDYNRKRKLMTGGGFIIPLLSLAIPALISLFRRR